MPRGSEGIFSGDKKKDLSNGSSKFKILLAISMQPMVWKTLRFIYRNAYRQLFKNKNDCQTLRY